MSTPEKTIEFRFERIIKASPTDVFEAWLDPKTPGTIWRAAEKFIIDAKVDGLFFWMLRGTSHYGRFSEVTPARKLQHTWVSPYTLGVESLVTVTFEPQGQNTRMTLVHSGLPDEQPAHAHQNGWNYFLDIFFEQFGDGSRKPYRWEDAHP